MVDLPTAGDDPGCDPLLGLAAENIPPGLCRCRLCPEWQFADSLVLAVSLLDRLDTVIEYIKYVLKKKVMLSYTYMIPFY
jgi:hypothetical protein